MDVQFNLSLEGIMNQYPVGLVSILLKQRYQKRYRNAHGHEILLQDFTVSEERFPLIHISVASPLHILNALMAFRLGHRLCNFLHEHLGRMSVDLSAGGLRGFFLSVDVQVVQIEVVHEDEQIERFLKKEASRILVKKLETLSNLNEVKAGGDKCAVCLEELENEEEEKRKLIMMPCSHIYHGSCISRWLEQQNSCPMCRRGIQAEDLVG